MEENPSLQEQIVRILTENSSVTGSATGDDEAEMASSELRSVIQNAQDIAELLTPGMELDAWVQSKITKAADYLTAVHDYMKGRAG